MTTTATSQDARFDATPHIEVLATRETTEANAKPSPPVRRKRRKKTYNKSMKLVRRIHMYFGLVLTPFVLLYGITAMLFNHPAWFSSGITESVEAGHFAEVEFDAADVLAAAIVSELTDEHELDVALIEGEDVRLRGDFIIDATTEEARTRYRLSRSDLSGTRQITEITPDVETPFPDAVVSPFGEPIETITTAIKDETEAERVRVRVAPDVEFAVTVDDEIWAVSCDVNTGALTVRPSDEPRRAIETRSFLTRLHVSRGYPSEVTARWIWAVIVDVVAGLMIFWALSGILMWWQMKPTRMVGGVTVVIGLALAGLLGYAMLRMIYY
ncbi:MAG: PepSY domain-containing protein [Planctomycetota bacterium]